MKARREARRIAIDVLYQAEIRDRLPKEAWTAYVEAGRLATTGDEERANDTEGSEEATRYALSLVEGVQENSAEIDALLAKHADRWAVDRMPIIDRTILRIAAFEILWGENVPVPVVINEAVELAKALSTEDSGRFVNGLLGRIAETSEPVED